MSKYKEKEEKNPEEISPKSLLEQLLKEGAKKMLQEAIENEVEEYIVKNQSKRDERGHRLAVRNGSLPEREILTGLGRIRVKQPRVDDRRLRNKNGAETFSSKILPRYLRRIPSISNLIPALYLRGISTGDFPRALAAILGERAQRAFCFQYRPSEGRMGGRV